MFLPFGFSIQEFFICYFYCQKMAFVCEFQHTPLWKLMMLSRFHTLCGYEICGYVPHSPRNKNLKSHTYSKTRFFWTPKHYCPPFTGAKKTFSSTLNVMISQMVRNETVRFGRYKAVFVKLRQIDEFETIIPIIAAIIKFVNCKL
jgi:hypothetical protein